MSKFLTIDDLLVAEIAGGRQTFNALAACPAISTLATSLATPDQWGMRWPDRVVDRRLQALRKAGKIEYRRGKWSMAPAKS